MAKQCYTISTITLSNLTHLAIIMTCILQLHAKITGNNNNILMEGF